MSEAAVFAVGSVGVVADLSGALFVPALKTLVVADLHLEKGSSLARAGALLPPYDSRETLAALTRAMAAHRPQRVVCLGDSFHDRTGPNRLSPPDRAVLSDLIAAVDWTWVAGNHDGAAAAGCGGRVVDALDLGPLLLRHEPGDDAGNGDGFAEVCGHFHPKASVLSGGRRVTARCFVTDGRRLVLPSFGAFTGGLDVFDPAIRSLFGGGLMAHLLGRRRVHSIPGAGLCAPRADPGPAAGRSYKP